MSTNIGCYVISHSANFREALGKIIGSSYLLSLRAKLPVSGRDNMDAKF